MLLWMTFQMPAWRRISWSQTCLVGEVAVYSEVASGLKPGSARPRVVEWLQEERLDEQPAECETVKTQLQQNSMDEEELPLLPDLRVNKEVKR